MAAVSPRWPHHIDVNHDSCSMIQNKWPDQDTPIDLLSMSGKRAGRDLNSPPTSPATQREYRMLEMASTGIGNTSSRTTGLGRPGLAPPCERSRRAAHSPCR
nr:hypothetical protein CFP56_22160 [Quercus suber]